MIRKIFAPAALALMVIATPVLAHERPTERTTATMRMEDRLMKDLGRLEVLLFDMQRDTTVTQEAWVVVANEAMSLANRVSAHARALSARTGDSELRQNADHLRAQVRELQRIVLRTNDTQAAREQARQALAPALMIDDRLA